MNWGSGRRVGKSCLLALALATGCRREEAPPPARAIGEAYVAPETLELRKDIALNSGAAGTAKRGEKVEILARRRRFVRVRTPGKAEGWTEQSQLLTPEVYEQIAQLARQAAGRPSMGIYRAREKLNVHFEPYRWSPGFYQLKEEEKVDLLDRKLAERTSGPPAQTSAQKPPPSEPARPVVYEDWCLVRAIAGGDPRPAGWVLARMIDADIPDEVAQYAEGQRITSYFPLAEVIDGDRTKKVWLWTTVSRGLQPHDFDSFRVFNWSRSRHRYETAAIGRGLTGFFPVSAAPSVETKYGKGPGFSLIIESKTGQRLVRRFVMVGHLVRLYAEEPEAPAEPAKPVAASSPPSPPPQQSWLSRFWSRIRRR